jgi:RalA-binding protein 1
VFKKSFKDEKRLKDIKESNKEGTPSKRSKKGKEKAEKHTKREHLFGNYLENVVQSFPCNDGVQMPYPIRICLDVIESKGIETENIYKSHSINKSHLEAFCDFVNKEKIETKLDELNAEPNLACGVLKKFLKELKSPLIPDEFITLLDKCDSNISDKDVANKIDSLKKSLARMPQINYDTISYLIMHFHKILNKVRAEKIRLKF